MQISITGGSQKHPSIDVNPQRTINMLYTSSGEGGRGKGALIPSAGLLEAIDLGDFEIRQLYKAGDYVYAVTGSSVYRLTVTESSRTVTSSLLGTLPTVTGTVRIAYNGTQVMFVDGSTQGYIYTLLNSGTVTLGPIGGNGGDTYTLTINSIPIHVARDVSGGFAAADQVTTINSKSAVTGVTASYSSPLMVLTAVDDRTITISESGTGFTAGTDGLTVTGGDFSTGTCSAFRRITDADFQGGQGLVFVDSYFIYSKPNTGYFYTSAENNGYSWNGADLATAETSSDAINSMAIIKGDLWLFGPESVEIWYNAANVSGSPFSPRAGFEMTIGCGAKDSVQVINDTGIWLDNRGFVVQTTASPLVRDSNSTYDLKIISYEGLTSEILSYSNWQDAVACTLTDKGHLLYQLTFITERKTWTYDLVTGYWSERTYTDPFFRDERAHLIQYATRYGALTLGGGLRDGKIYWYDAIYKDDNGDPINRKRITSVISSDFKLLGIDLLEIRAQTGVVSQNLNPYISLRYSNDGGHTWSDELSRSLGAVGEYNKRLRWNRLGTGNEWVFEFTITDEIDFALIDATVEITEVEL